MTTAQIEEVNGMLDFMLGGKATFSLRSKPTGRSYTYRVERAENRSQGSAYAPLRWFVSLLTGPDNSRDYSYIGLLEQMSGDVLRFRTTKKSILDDSATSVQAITWLVRQLVNEDISALKQLEFWHRGRCCRCGRLLTEPESIRLGIGPVCREKA